MAESTVRGSFVWHDLMTSDIPAAVAYYGKVVGWKTQAFDANYLMWAAKTGPLGGLGALPSGHNMAHWLSYVATSDIDATLQLTQKLGGKVIKPVTDISNGGKYAVLADPQGAVFGVHWSPESAADAAPSSAPMSVPPVGTFAWLELATTDYQAAFAFYQALFGWEKVDAHDMGEMGIYFIYGMNGRPFGGMFTCPPSMPMPTAWCGYVQVADARKTAKVIAKAGGKVINGPMPVPGGSWIAQAIDPQGAMHAVVSTAPMTAAASEPGAQTDDKPASAKAKVVKKKAVKKKVAAKPKSVTKAAKKSAKKKLAKKAAKKVAKKKVSKVAPKKKSAKKKLMMKKSSKKAVKKSGPVKKKKVAKRKK